MKKIVLILILGMVALISFSCKKEKQCLCSTWYKDKNGDKELVNQITVTIDESRSCVIKNSGYEHTEGEWTECK
jgi:hypothetical protein